MTVKTIKINDMEVEPTCWNCGKTIKIDQGELFVVSFDYGTVDHPIYGPGTEAEFYIECLECRPVKK